MTIADDFEAERKKIEELWSKLKPEIIRDLVNVWIDREQLNELRADAERLEPKVIKLLEILSTSKKHTPEYHFHTVHLISLLHNVKSKESWRQKIIEDLDYISGVADKIHEAIEARKKLRMAHQTPNASSSVEETPEKRWDRIRNESRPPQKSFKDFAETTDRKDWIFIQPNWYDAYAIPYPIEHPKSYYIIPNPDWPNNKVNALTKFYPDMENDNFRCQYLIQKIAWIQAEVLERVKIEGKHITFDGDRVDAMWTVVGESGITKMTRKKEQVGSDYKWRF